MSGKLHGSDSACACWIHCPDRTTAVADIQSPGGGVVAHVVRVVAKRHALAGLEVVEVDKLKAFSLTVGHGNNTSIHGNRDPLRLAKARQALQVDGILHI